MQPGKLIIFSAPSGSGKSTIINYLLTQNLNLAFSISATSRAPRGEEKTESNITFSPPTNFAAVSPPATFWNTKRCTQTNFTGH